MCKFYAQTIILILTEDNEVLGGFVDDYLQYDGNRYHGTGDCFLFGWNCKQPESEEARVTEEKETTMMNTEIFQAGLTNPELLQPKIEGHYQSFKSSEENNFYFYCDSEGFGFGGE